MVIRKEDRVSTVLRYDESLIDVFTSLSPVFERLRNPATRKVMARLVTVEQASRIAGVNANDLVEQLNRGSHEGSGAGRSADVALEDVGVSREGTDGVGVRPPALETIAAEDIVEVDVREDLRAGREPFSRIMAARREVPDGGALCLRAIFEPVPLYAVMAKQGLTHHTERLSEEDWQVWFYAPAPTDVGNDGAGAGPGAAPGVATGTAPDATTGAAVVPPEDSVLVLDVRGLEPPEPMVRTLSALETLPEGGTLVQLNVRVPQFLLPMLEQRGYTYEIREQEAGLVRVFIRRAGT